LGFILFWSRKQTTNIGSYYLDAMPDQNNMKPKDMMLIPQRLALALQADGWWVRSDIIWAKPNPMPESVTDRPTKSHEYIWLLSKSKDYFWDQEAVKEISISDPNSKASQMFGSANGKCDTIEKAHAADLGHKWEYSSSRNLRTVWNIATQPYSGAHYATYPEELVLRCLKAATSERGCCPKCGKMWEREVERIVPEMPTANRKEPYSHGGKNSCLNVSNSGNYKPTSTTLGFRPGCACNLPPVPATVLDPFAGSGTTLLVAKRMGLSAIGLDLSYQYLRENAWERVGMSQPVMV